MMAFLSMVVLQKKNANLEAVLKRSRERISVISRKLNVNSTKARVVNYGLIFSREEVFAGY